MLTLKSNNGSPRWQKLFIKSTVWLAAEISLTLLGLDNLADYSEYLLSEKVLEQVSRDRPGIVSEA